MISSQAEPQFIVVNDSKIIGDIDYSPVKVYERIGQCFEKFNL